LRGVPLPALRKVAFCRRPVRPKLKGRGDLAPPRDLRSFGHRSWRRRGQRRRRRGRLRTLP